MYPLKIRNEYAVKHEKMLSKKKQDTKVYEWV